MRMEQGGWQPVLPPIPMPSPPHRHGASPLLIPFLAYISLCAAMAIAILVLLHHIDIGPLW